MSKIEEIERLKELKQQAKELDHKIMQYSIYPNKEVAYTLKKLLIEFETIPFRVAKTTMTYGYFLYSPGRPNSSIILKNNIESFPTWEFEDIPVDHIVLCPTAYEKTTNYYTKANRTKHISQFIDFAFQKRIENNLINVTEQDLNNILEEYIQTVKQEEKKTVITEEQKQREAFEKTCMIDRESFFDAIANVVTNSEEKATSSTDYSKQENTLTHSIYILAQGHLKDYKVTILKGKQESAPYVNFFEVKNYFSYAYENINNFHTFMDEIESLFKEKRILEKSDIDSIDLRENESIKQMKKSISEN